MGLLLKLPTFVNHQEQKLNQIVSEGCQVALQRLKEHESIIACKSDHGGFPLCCWSALGSPPCDGGCAVPSGCQRQRLGVLVDALGSPRRNDCQDQGVSLGVHEINSLFLVPSWDTDSVYIPTKGQVIVSKGPQNWSVQSPIASHNATVYSSLKITCNVGWLGNNNCT